MPRSYWVETLGCPKNQVDSDKLIGTLAADGMVPASGRLEYAQVVDVEPVVESEELFATVIGVEPVRESSTTSSPKLLQLGPGNLMDVLGTAGEEHLALTAHAHQLAALVGDRLLDEVAHRARALVLELELPLIGDHCAFGGERIHMGRAGQFVAVAAHLRSVILTGEPEDVGAVGGMGAAAEGRREHQKGRENGFHGVGGHPGSDRLQSVIHCFDSAVAACP